MVGNKAWLLVLVLAAGLCGGGGCGEKKPEAENHGFLEGGEPGAAGVATPSPLGAESIYVSNYGNGTVMKFAANGAGAVYAQALGAQGVAFDSKNNMYVANWYQQSIWKITPEGQRLVFARTGMLYTYGLAVDRSDNVYVAIYQGNKIMKFAPDGTGSVIATDLKGPVALTFDQAGNLYVANNSGHTIEKFGPDGRRSVFIESGLSGPNGMAFDRAGNLFVANGNNNTIEKFSPTGQDLGVFAREGLHNPVGLAFDRVGNLYAVNWEKDAKEGGDWRVMKFTPGGAASVFAKNGLNAPTFIAIRTEKK